jgi:hypothetical protein
MLDSGRLKAFESTLREPVIILDTLRFGWPVQSTPLLQIDRLEPARGEHLHLHSASGGGKSPLIGLIPSIRRYRYSLAGGMTVRV